MTHIVLQVTVVHSNLSVPIHMDRHRDRSQKVLQRKKKIATSIKSFRLLPRPLVPRALLPWEFRDGGDAGDGGDEGGGGGDMEHENQRSS